MNIRGLLTLSNKTKVSKLQTLAENYNATFIGLTETHLHPDIMNGEISMDGYNCIRSDRNNRSHGGVCLYLNKYIKIYYNQGYI